LYARVQGVLTILDWKTGRAIYPEALLQNVAYRHAARRLGLPSSQGLIVRLPKLLEDPAWEVMTVPNTVPLGDFLAALRLWRWQRRSEGRPFGPPAHRKSLLSDGHVAWLLLAHRGPRLPGRRGAVYSWVSWPWSSSRRPTR